MANRADKRFGQRNVATHSQRPLAFAIEIGLAVAGALGRISVGSLVLNVLKEELSQERKRRFRAFALGAFDYAALPLSL